MTYVNKFFLFIKGCLLRYLLNIDFFFNSEENLMCINFSVLVTDRSMDEIALMNAGCSPLSERCTSNASPTLNVGFVFVLCCRYGIQ